MAEYDPFAAWERQRDDDAWWDNPPVEIEEEGPRRHGTCGACMANVDLEDAMWRHDQGSEGEIEIRCPSCGRWLFEDQYARGASNG